jgi:hypothetical protein
MFTGTGKILRLENMNPLVKQADYAVRGEVALRADKLKSVIINNIIVLL